MQAIAQCIVLTLDDHRGELDKRLKEVALVELDMTAEFDRGADAMVVVVALGPCAITERYLGIVLIAVELDHCIEVVTAASVQPRGVGAGIIAVDAAGTAPAQVEVRAAVTCQQPDQPLAVAKR
ncbi:hypothetical protein D3C81_1809080 [compost metagenome]